MVKIIVCVFLAFLFGCQGTEEKNTAAVSAIENKDIIQPTVAEKKEIELGYSSKSVNVNTEKVRTIEEEGGLHGDYLKKHGLDPKKMDNSDMDRIMGLK